MKQQAYRSEPLPLNTYGFAFYGYTTWYGSTPMDLRSLSKKALDATYKDRASEYPLMPSARLLLRNDSTIANQLPKDLQPYFLPQMEISLQGAWLCRPYRVGYLGSATPQRMETSAILVYLLAL